MAKIQDFRSDFRKGRTGNSLRIRQDSEAYFSSLKDAENMMVLSDGRIARRWGTHVRMALTEAARIEVWDYAESETLQFILVFEAGTLRILDLTLAVRHVFTGLPWTTVSKDYLSLTFDRNKIIVTDETFKPIFFKFDGTSFTTEEFDFKLSDDQTRIRAPFFQFADPAMEVSPTIFTSKGLSTGYGSFIATALGIPSGNFDLALGTGKLTSDQDFFKSEHVGSRLRVLDGEVEITAVNANQREANIIVHRDVAKKLEPNPFYCRKGSKLIECSMFDHGLSVGDEVFFVGISDLDALDALMTNACKYASDSTSVAAPSSGAATYVITRVVGKDAFEFLAGGTAITEDVLTGGSDVMVIPKNGIKNVKEPAFSNARGWPTACTVHERRLWLGGTTNLPDAAWASQFADFTNFDTGDGNTTDAIALYGIGRQARIRHLVSSFDLQIFTDNQELYIPGSSVQVMEQSTIRVVSSTEIGCSFTKPYKFDGGVFYVDKVGTSIREYASANRESDYSSQLSSIVVGDWVKAPKDSCPFVGSDAFGSTSYLIYSGMSDGSALVMHAQRNDDSFGWMRWTLGEGSFLSFAAIEDKLFAVAKRGTNHFLVQFDTSSYSYITTDFSQASTASSTTATASNHAAAFVPSRTVQVTGAASGGQLLVYEGVTLDSAGAFQTVPAATQVTVGDPMSYSFELHAPVVQTPTGPMAGKFQRIVSAEVNWDNAMSGEISGQTVITPEDRGDDLSVNAVDEWREYYIGDWGREPTLSVSGNEPGRMGVRGLIMNMYF
tara:strand:- start:454 stop:2790 length:2337 start_codon:yes stop_codon:yes gene_type:complete